MIGLALPLARALEVPIVCTLQGEDLFLDGLPESHRAEAIDLIREQVEHVDAFMAVSDYYAGFMGKLLAIPAEKMTMVPLGINFDGYKLPEPPEPPEYEDGPLKIGYFARIAPEKGLHNLVEAYRLLRERSGLPATRLEVAGYLGREHRDYLDKAKNDMRRYGLGDEFHYHGVLDRQEKIDFLRSLAVVSVPTDYEEPKGIFLLEAMAAGTPVVQPRKELSPRSWKNRRRFDRRRERCRCTRRNTGALVPGRSERQELGRRGSEGVRRHYRVSDMAQTNSRRFREARCSGAGF